MLGVVDQYTLRHLRLFCARVIAFKHFDNFFLVLIVVNTFTLAMEYEGMSRGFEWSLDLVNAILTVAFLIEVLPPLALPCLVTSTLAALSFASCSPPVLASPRLATPRHASPRLFLTAPLLAHDMSVKLLLVPRSFSSPA